MYTRFTRGASPAGLTSLSRILLSSHREQIPKPDPFQVTNIFCVWTFLCRGVWPLYFLSCMAQQRVIPWVPGKDSNRLPCLPYGRRRTNHLATVYAKPLLFYARPQLSKATPFLSYMPHPNLATPHPVLATQHPQLIYITQRSLLTILWSMATCMSIESLENFGLTLWNILIN